MFFSYKAINSLGIKVSGTIEGRSVESVENLLAKNGNIPIKVELTGGGKTLSLVDRLFNKVTGEDLILFTRQFQVMVDAGVTILKIFSILKEQTENIVLKDAIGGISQDLESGTDLYDAFSKYPHIFPPLYCALLRAGEKSGSLGEVLKRLAYVIGHENEVKRSVKSALRYPLMVVAFLGIAFVILLTFVVPRFSSIFTRAGLELPWPTKICISLSNILVENWLVIIVAVVLLIVAYRLAIKTNRVRLVRDRFFLNAPLFGNLVQKAIMSRFTSVFSILQKSGVSVLSSLEILEGSLNNQAITEEFMLVKERLNAGEGIAKPLRDSKYFPPLVVNMISIGEETGKLDIMLSEVSEHYDIEVEFAVKKLTDMLPTVLTVGLAVVVGFFALAIYMPMWDLTKLAKH